MEDLSMQICPICGITRREQEIQEELVSVQHSLNLERWKQHHAPGEPAPGLLVTDEYRVHNALFLYNSEIASSQKSNAKDRDAALNRVVQKTGADYNSVARALKYANKIS